MLRQQAGNVHAPKQTTGRSIVVNCSMINIHALIYFFVVILMTALFMLAVVHIAHTCFSLYTRMN